jgi:hypothetical protein
MVVGGHRGAAVIVSVPACSGASQLIRGVRRTETEAGRGGRSRTSESHFGMLTAGRVQMKGLSISVTLTIR